jgi:hypothetical protein
MAGSTFAVLAVVVLGLVVVALGLALEHFKGGTGRSPPSRRPTARRR